MPEVSCEPVADVEHGVDLAGLRQPASLLEAGLEVQMLAGQGSPQFPSDEEGVALAPTGAQDGLSLGYRSEDGDAHPEALGACRGLTSDNGDLVSGR